MKAITKKLKWLYKNCKFTTPYLVGLISIGSIISLITVGKSLGTKYLIDSATNHNKPLMLRWIIILGVLFTVNILLTSLESVINTYGNEKLKNRIQKYIYNNIIKSKWENISQYHSVDLLTRITNDVSSICSVLVDTLPEILSLFVMLIFSFIALLTISKTMALLSIIIFPILIFLSKVYGKKLKYFYIELQKKESSYGKFIQESFNNILILKSFSLESIKLRSLNQLQQDKFKLSMKKSYFGSVSNGLLSLSSLLGYFVVLIWGAFNISNNHNTFGSLTAMLQLFSSVQAPIYCLSSSFPKIISVFGAIERINEIETMEQEEYIKMYYSSITPTNIKFKNVSFGYDNKKLILDNVSFNINSGEIIGIVGPSGEGKTTLIRLILSLLSPKHGEILINNDQLTISHRELIAYVPQGNTLFSGTIRENLSLSNRAISDKEIEQSLYEACALDFVNSYKDKLDTFIDEKATELSEGQAQRLCIARAFLRNSPILILDESTSALDSDTETKILDSIKSLKNKPTCIIITHRQSALSICDKVFKLQNSNIAIAQEV